MFSLQECCQSTTKLPPPDPRPSLKYFKFETGMSCNNKLSQMVYLLLFGLQIVLNEMLNMSTMYIKYRTFRLLVHFVIFVKAIIANSEISK